MCKSYKKILYFLILTLTLISCSSNSEPVIRNEAQSPNEYLDFSPEQDRIYVKDENAKNIFKEYFHASNINDCICYLVDDKLNISVYCNNNINKDDIKNIELYFSKILILKQYETYPVPFGELHNKRINYDSCVLRTFVDDKLLTYDEYDFNTNSFKYYENMSLNLSSRDYKDDYSLTVNKKINQEVKKCVDISTVKPFKGYAVMFRIMTDGKIDDNAINSIKNIIESNLAERTDINSYVGIIVELSTGSEPYAELTYLNGLNKRWSNEKWETIDFVKESVTVK